MASCLNETSPGAAQHLKWQLTKKNTYCILTQPVWIFPRIMNEQDLSKEYLTVGGRKAHDINYNAISASTL